MSRPHKGGGGGRQGGGKSSSAPGRSSGGKQSGPSRTGARRSSTGKGATGKASSGGRRDQPTRGGAAGGGRQRGIVHNVPVPEGAQVLVVGREHGIDLAHFLAELVPGKLSVRAVRRALDQGRCLVNGRAESFGSVKLRRGDVVAFIPPGNDQRQPFRFDRRRLVHEDEHLIAYDKPPGLPVTPTDAGKGPNLLHLLRDGLSGPLEAAHRIDADTSGIVLFARGTAMLAHLQQAFETHTIVKTYHALVRGRPKPKGERKSWLALVEQGTGYERWGSGRGPGSLQAVTTWVVEDTIGSHASLVLVRPKSGRTHQIRVHFAEMGHPLFGDRVYGDRKDPVFAPRHLLHASRIRVPLPDGKTLDLHCRLPPDFKQVMKALAG